MQYFMQVYKELGQYFIENDETLTNIGAAGYICSSIARLFTGLIVDCIDSPKRLNNYVLCLLFLQMLTLRLALEHEIAYAVSVCTVMACEGASVTLLAVMVMR